MTAESKNSNGNFVTLRFGKTTLDVLIDTGASKSMMNENTAHRLKLKITPLQSNEYANLFSANGSRISVSGTVEVTLHLQGAIVNHTVYVSPNLLHNFLLGTDFLMANEATVNYQLGVLTLFDDLVRLPLHSRFDSVNCVKLARTVCIPAMCEAILPAVSPSAFNNKSVLLESFPQMPLNKLAVAKALAFCENNRTVCRVWNFNPHVLTLRKGLRLAKIESFDTIASIDEFHETTELPSNDSTNEETQKMSKNELDDFHRNYGFQLGPTLTDVQRYQILEVLYRHKHVFARDLSEVKECKGPPMEIELHTQRKCFRRQYRLSEEDTREADRQILEMESAGIIEPSNTPFWNSAIFLVRKKNNQKRLVVDLRELNKLIVPKLIQLPKIDELLEEINQGNPKWLSTFDLTAAFWHVSVAENSRKYLSFSGPDGRRWMFRRTPFGLANSPHALLQIVSKLFSDRRRFSTIRCYMDDVITWSVTWSEHLRQIELTLKTLESANLSCNPRKTEIGFESIEYLGYRISGSSLRLSERRIEAIGKINAPKNLKGLQRCLGMFCFWRRHIPNYAKNTFNMRQLLKKNTPFKWNTACQTELDYLKSCLTSDPILRALDPNRDIQVATDSSIYGFGWMVTQHDDDGNFYVTSYGAKSTTPAQRNYTTDDLELISVMYALKSIESFALHKHITVFTDNTHVLHFMDWKPVSRRQQRMISYLLQFNLTVRFTKGKHNLVPDALSRIFQDASDEERRHNEPRDMHSADDFILPIMTRSQTRAALDDLNTCAEPSCSTEITNAPTDTAPQLTDARDGRIELQIDHDAVNGSDGVDDPHPIPECDDTTPNDSGQQVSNTDDLINLPDICADDYETDEEFQHVYRYLQTGVLSDIPKIDKMTLLMNDRFLIEDGLLFRIDCPRRKRLARVRPVARRLCVPKVFRHEILKHMHDNCGHYSTQNLFVTLSTKFYWKTLFSDIDTYICTCNLCLRNKVNLKHRSVPLNPVDVPVDINYRIAIDHKILTRETKAGNRALLIAVEVFSGYVHIIPVPDTTAITSAKALVSRVIPIHGIMKEIVSDKGPSFMSALFKEINRLLGIHHVTSAALNPRANGMAESVVKRVSEYLKYYAKDDFNIEDTIPLVELCLRGMAHSKLELSPHEILMGRPLNLGVPCDPHVTPPDVPKDKIAYFQWLATELRRLHDAIRKSREEAKAVDKMTYDKARKVVEPHWQVGDLVLLENKKVKPGAVKVLTRQRFFGPYIIREIVQNRPGFGAAYQLVTQDGKIVKNLVTSDRLKAYNVDRTDFTKRLPRLINGPHGRPMPSKVSTGRDDKPLTEPEEDGERPLQIVSEKNVRGKKKYYVRYSDGKIYLCDWVNPVLLNLYKETKRPKRQTTVRRK